MKIENQEAHEPSQVKSYYPVVHRAWKVQSASPLRGLGVGASTIIKQQEMPRRMNCSGSADKALGEISTDQPPPDWQCRSSYYLPAGVRVLRGGRTPPHWGHIVVRVVS
jgi:hypothetical protein